MRLFPAVVKQHVYRHTVTFTVYLLPDWQFTVHCHVVLLPLPQPHTHSANTFHALSSVWGCLLQPGDKICLRRCCRQRESYKTEEFGTSYCTSEWRGDESEFSLTKVCTDLTGLVPQQIGKKINNQTKKTKKIDVMEWLDTVVKGNVKRKGLIYNEVNSSLV